jgi:hypothetical protein
MINNFSWRIQPIRKEILTSMGSKGTGKGNPEREGKYLKRRQCAIDSPFYQVRKRSPLGIELIITHQER